MPSPQQAEQTRHGYTVAVACQGSFLEGLICLAVLVVVGLPCLALLLVARLGARIADLERRLRGFERALLELRFRAEHLPSAAVPPPSTAAQPPPIAPAAACAAEAHPLAPEEHPLAPEGPAPAQGEPARAAVAPAAAHAGPAPAHEFAAAAHEAAAAAPAGAARCDFDPDSAARLAPGAAPRPGAAAAPPAPVAVPPPSPTAGQPPFTGAAPPGSAGPPPFSAAAPSAAAGSPSSSAAASPGAVVGSPDAVAVEERIGARIITWIAALALFLAGAFLVKYTFDRGLLGPAARVLIGTAFGAALLAAGEWLRRRAPYVAQGLTAAGVADLFACFLAATNLYHLVSPAVGFSLLVGATALAIVLSLRQGPFVALLGLVGGFATPALIGAAEPRPGPLFGYLLLLELGLLLLTRRRGWWPLTALTMLGAFFWAALWLTRLQPGDTLFIGPFLLASSAALLASTWPARVVAAGPAGSRIAAGLGGALLGGLLLALLVGRAGYQPLDWAFLGVLGAGALLLARLDPRYLPLPAATAALSLALLVSWPLAAAAFDAARCGWTVLALGVLYGGGGYAALWGSRQPVFWAGLSGLSAVALLLTAYLVGAGPPPGWRWGWLALLLAGLAAAAALPLVRRRAQLSGGQQAAGLLVVAASAFLSMAVPLELAAEWFAVAFALEALALVALAGRLGWPLLHAPAAALAAATVAQLLLLLVSAPPVGPTPIWNIYLYAYGLPAAALAGAALLLQRQQALLLAEGCCGGALLATFLLVTLEVRHFFHPPGAAFSPLGLHELATLLCGWGVLGLAWLEYAARRPSEVQHAAGRLLLGFCALLALSGLLLVYNPLAQPVRLSPTPLWNDLLYLYGGPALLLGLAAWRTPRSEGPLHLAAGLLLLVALLMLEIRHFFHPLALDRSAVELLEAGSWNNALLLLAAGLLLAGGRRPAGRARAGLTAAGAARAADDRARAADDAARGAEDAARAADAGARGAGDAARDSVAAAPLGAGAARAAPAAAPAAFGARRIADAAAPASPGARRIADDAAPASARAGRIAEDAVSASAAAGGAADGSAAAAADSAPAAAAAATAARATGPGAAAGGGLPLGQPLPAELRKWLQVGRPTLAELRTWLRLAGRAVALGALGLLAVTLLLTHNPLLRPLHIGGPPLLNELLFNYGLPAGLLAWLGALLAGRGFADAALLLRSAALLLLLAQLSLEVRRAFRGPLLAGSPPVGAELLAYSAAWLGLGLALLAAALVTRAALLRWASLLLMLLAVGKVFLYDTANLRDLYRVFALLGLGLSLMLLAFCYQRFVFGSAARPRPAGLE